MVDPVTASTAFWDVKASELLKFVSTVISAVAWPLGTFFILRLFKGEVVKLIPSISKFSAMGVTAEFNQGLNKAEANVAKVTTEPKHEALHSLGAATSTDPVLAPEPTKAVSADLAISYAIEGAPTPDPATLRANPNGIVMVAWANLESALREYGNSAARPIATKRRIGPEHLVDRLQDGGMLSADEAAAIRKLLELRNLAAHSNEKISEDDALRFKEMADRLTASYRTTAVAAVQLRDEQSSPSPASVE